MGSFFVFPYKISEELSASNRRHQDIQRPAKALLVQVGVIDNDCMCMLLLSGFTVFREAVKGNTMLPRKPFKLRVTQGVSRCMRK